MVIYANMGKIIGFDFPFFLNMLSDFPENIN